MQASLSVAEASRILSTTELTVRRWINSKQLRAIKVGRQWRVLPDDLEAFMGAGANRPPNQAPTEAATPNPSTASV